MGSKDQFDLDIEKTRKEWHEENVKKFSAAFMDAKRADVEAAVMAILAAASINILSITEVVIEGSGCGYIINYEYQWKSRGNYIWNKNSYVACGDYELNPNTAYGPIIIDRVKRARNLLEDPNDRGKYTYIEVQ